MMLNKLLKTGALASLVALVGVASAQDMNFGLSADDAAYLTTASENGLAALGSSFQQDFTLDVSVTGVPDGGDFSLNIVGTGPVIANPENTDLPLNASLAMDVTIMNAGEEQAASLEVRAVDGILYVENPETPGEWAGFSVADAVASQGAAADPANLDLSALGLSEEDLAVLLALPNAEGFLSQTRDGEVFTFTADLAALFASEEWTTLTTQVGPRLQENEQTAQFAMLLPALPMLLPEGTITIEQIVDPSLNAVTELSFIIDGTVNAGAMMGDSSADPIVLNVTFNVVVSDIGGEFAPIEVPENVEMQDMSGMGMGN